MYSVANRVWVKPEWFDEFENRFRNRAGQIDKQPGFIRMQILKPATDDTPFVVLTTWENKEAFLTWTRSEDFRIAHQNPMPKDAFAGEGKLEQHDIVISTDD